MNSTLLLCTFGAILMTCLDESLVKAAPVHSETRNLNPVTTPRPVLSDDHRKQWQGGCNQDCGYDIHFYCDHQDKWCHACGMFCDSGDEDDKCKEECPARYDSLHPNMTLPPAEQTPAPVSRNKSTPSPTGSSVQQTNKTTSLSGNITPDITPPGTINDTLSVNVSHPKSDTSHKHNQTNKFDPRWLYGLLCLVVAIVCVGIYIKMNRPKMCIRKTPDAIPTQCSEDHSRAPAFYKQRRGEQAHNTQRGADQPLMSGRQPLMAGRQPLVQPSSATQGQAMPLETLGGRNQLAASRFGQPSNSSSNSNGRVLVTGADDSFVYSDQSPDQSTQV